MDFKYTPINSDQAVELILTELHAELSSEQGVKLDLWLRESEGNRNLFLQVQDIEQRAVMLRQFIGYDTPAELKAIRGRLNIPDGEIQSERFIGKLNFRPGHWMIAASLFMLIFAGLFYFYTNVSPGSVEIGLASNKAVLKFSNGKTIELSEGEMHVVISGDTLKYSDGSLIETADGNGEELEFSTPKGGQYQLTLDDGTRVALNAGTTLRIPRKFATTERVVTVEGEAYFEVSHRPNQPFYVKSRGQQVRVLGTVFNVRAYVDEPETKTTLVQGSVQVSAAFAQKWVLLRPGEQAKLGADQSLISGSASIESEIAWYQGAFSFDNKPFDVVMLEISRYYDVDVVYEDGVPDVQLFGSINHSKNLRTILQVLKASDVACRLEGKKLIIGRFLSTAGDQK